MPRLTSFDCLCCPKTMMAFYARHRLIVRDVQGRCCHATPDVVRPCVLSKGSDVMARLTSFDHVCYPRELMSCHA